MRWDRGWFFGVSLMAHKVANKHGFNPGKVIDLIDCTWQITLWEAICFHENMEMTNCTVNIYLFPMNSSIYNQPCLITRVKYEMHPCGEWETLYTSYTSINNMTNAFQSPTLANGYQNCMGWNASIAPKPSKTIWNILKPMNINEWLDTSLVHP